MEGERIEGGDDVNGKIIGGGGGEWEEMRRGERRGEDVKGYYKIKKNY